VVEDVLEEILCVLVEISQTKPAPGGCLAGNVA
jgi:hypothetical protein